MLWKEHYQLHSINILYITEPCHNPVALKFKLKLNINLNTENYLSVTHSKLIVFVLMLIKNDLSSENAPTVISNPLFWTFCRIGVIDTARSKKCARVC